MSVTIDATASAASSGIFGTHFQSTNMTVGTGVNRVLLVGTSFVFDPGAITLIWDYTGTNQTMSLVASATNGSVMTKIFGLVNPISGNKILRADWANDSGASGASYDSISFNGANQTGGTTTFYNATSTVGAGATSSLTINSHADDYVVEAISNGAYNNIITSVTTAMYHLATSPGGGMSYGQGLSSMTISWDTATHGWAEAAVGIASVPGYSFNMAGI